MTKKEAVIVKEIWEEDKQGNKYQVAINN